MTAAPPIALTEFLRARIAEDELTVLTGDCRCPDGEPQRPDCPDRILADIEAKRRVVDEHCWDASLPQRPNSQCPTCLVYAPCATLLALALPYADHPDFRPEWRP